MQDWKLNNDDLKHYPHFDKILSLSEANAIVINHKRVSQNSYFPFLLYHKKYQPFRSNADGTQPKSKERKIRYAARRDAYIFSYYRRILAKLYEAKLKELGIDGCPIAYRRIPVDDHTVGGKCNIHFACDAFQCIQGLENCCAIAVDISSYFESIDHEHLKSIWKRLLNTSELPPDHFSVFKNITKYHVVDRLEVYTRLGFYGEKFIKNGKPVLGYLTPYHKIPKQICSTQEFREKILGENGLYPSLVQRNKENCGIPQGAPISDLLANLYLLDFDKEMNDLALDLGGRYMRYSDDILLILPVNSDRAIEIMHQLPSIIEKYGSQLIIKPAKSSLVKYTSENGRQSAQLIEGKQGKNGLEYLGFRYNGSSVYIRDATLSNLYRKLKAVTRNQAEATVKRYADKDAEQIQKHFNFEELMKRFGRVENFETCMDHRKWTFWTYASRSIKIFGKDGRTISSQIKRMRHIARKQVPLELERAIRRRKEGNTYISNK